MTETEPSDRREFETLVRAHQALVFAVAYGVLRDRARSEEIAQDAFLIAWRDRTRVTPSVRWICGIARNLARNTARRRKEVPMPHDSATHLRDAREELIGREDAARAEAGLASLPERYREAVVLFYGGEESIADVATVLGISEPAARQRLHRGRQRLRDALQAVESELRKLRPTAAFTVACVAALAAGKTPSARAATIPKRPLAALVGAGVLVLGASAAIVTVARSAHRDITGASATVQTHDPRAGLQRRFPASARPISPSLLPRGAYAVVTPATSSLTPSMSTTPPSVPPVVDYDFHQAPMPLLMRMLGTQLGTPIWVAYETDAKIDIVTHGERPAIDVLDEVLDGVGASRAEVAAIRIVPGGSTDAAVLGGEPLSLSVRNEPLNYVLDVLEPRLGMPIARLGEEVPQVPPGGSLHDENGNPLVEQSPPVTLDLHNVAAGVALQQALLQAGVGYELTTGFVILPQ